MVTSACDRPSLQLLPLPPPGTTVRVAARAVDRGRVSALSSVATLVVQAPPPAGKGGEQQGFTAAYIQYHQVQAPIGSGQGGPPGKNRQGG